MLPVENSQKQMRKEVLEVFKDYREYKELTGIANVKPLLNDSEENEARKQYFLQMLNLIEKVDAAVSRLSEKEQLIVRKRYLDTSTLSDIQIYEELKISRRTFYSVKKDLLNKMAILID